MKIRQWFDLAEIITDNKPITTLLESLDANCGMEKLCLYNVGRQDVSFQRFCGSLPSESKENSFTWTLVGQVGWVESPRHLPQKACMSHARDVFSLELSLPC